MTTASRYNRNNRNNGAERAPVDHYQVITDRFLAGIEQVLAGKVATPPWRCPWKVAGGMGGGLPRNGISGRAYSGVNVFLLWFSGREDRRWYTYKQVAERNDGSHVRRGEKSEAIVFYRILKKKDADGVERTFPLLRTFSVFNFAQIEWGKDTKEAKEIEARLASTESAQETPDTSSEAAMLRAKLHALLGDKLSHGGASACYSPTEDRVRMPLEASFRTPEHYVATLAHETAHWTGHASRLARDLKGRFGSDAYATEELVAELAAALVCGAHGLDSADLDEGHRAYLAHWAKVLRADKYALFAASRLARTAAEYIAPTEQPEEAEEEEGTPATA
jgi:antirestriction protein ArdC